jgi:hypothetical protein
MKSGFRIRASDLATCGLISKARIQLSQAAQDGIKDFMKLP